MNINSKATYGFREIEHTADWELEVWAPDIPALLVQAAHGMYALVDTRLENENTIIRNLTIQADDYEELLVSFLTELIFIAEDEGLGFYQYDLRIDDDLLRAELHGKPIETQNKEIKAVTYHNLSVIETSNGYTTNIVFDV